MPNAAIIMGSANFFKIIELYYIKAIKVIIQSKPSNLPEENET
jgi:hypothetical protein